MLCFARAPAFSGGWSQVVDVETQLLVGNSYSHWDDVHATASANQVILHHTLADRIPAGKPAKKQGWDERLLTHRSEYQGRFKTVARQLEPGAHV